ncbi:MAG: hypothetical protein EPO29_06665 [Betaproteobacteria bacterium]|nr:MAG: hypothetical protein EPO29_06665 [Betaproteobacteria bacterium]
MRRQLPEDEADRPLEPKPPREVLLLEDEREVEDDDEDQVLGRELNQAREPEDEDVVPATRTASIAWALGRGRPSG